MRNAEITKQKILIESGNLFNTQGYQATSISDITKATGLTKGAIYRHFESKSDLEQQALKALSDLMFFELGTAIKKATNFTSKMEATFLFFEKYMGTPLYKGGCPLLNAAVEVDETHSVLRKQVREMLLQLKTSLKTIIQNGIEKGQVKDTTNTEFFSTILLATLEGGIMMSKLEGSKNVIVTVITHLRSIVKEISI